MPTINEHNSLPIYTNPAQVIEKIYKSNFQTSTLAFKPPEQTLREIYKAFDKLLSTRGWTEVTKLKVVRNNTGQFERQQNTPDDIATEVNLLEAYKNVTAPLMSPDITSYLLSLFRPKTNNLHCDRYINMIMPAEEDSHPTEILCDDGTFAIADRHCITIVGANCPHQTPESWPRPIFTASL